MLHSCISSSSTNNNQGKGSSHTVSSHMLRLPNRSTTNLISSLLCHSIHLLLSNGAPTHHRSKATASIRRAGAVDAVVTTIEEEQSRR